MYTKILLVSGCSSGIGGHLFNYFRDNGYNAYGISRTKGDILVDATHAGEVYEAIKKIKPDILINCIGIGGMNAMLTTDNGQYHRIINANLTSAFNLIREASRRMYLKEWGRIINFTSCAVSMEIEGESVYGAAKSGLEHFSRVVSRELAPSVSVNCIGLGPVATRLISRVPRKKIEAVIDRQIIKKMTTFEEITTLVEFLISKEAGCITGQTIYINGAG